MPKQGEINYLKNIGLDGIHHAAHKPFSDPECGKYLIQLGAILSLLPPPPGRLLDLGAGTGWTSCFFARRGYEVVGQDICADMIYHARLNKEQYGVGDNLSFVIGDYEDLHYEDEFDCAVFFDALHHAVNEEEALRTVFRALRPGGVCLTSEPGVGHGRKSRAVSDKYGVTEKDMPATKIIALGKQVGFTSFRVYPHVSRVGDTIYRKPGFDAGLFLKRWAWSLLPYYFAKHHGGIVVLTK